MVLKILGGGGAVTPHISITVDLIQGLTLRILGQAISIEKFPL